MNVTSFPPSGTTTIPARSGLSPTAVHWSTEGHSSETMWLPGVISEGLQTKANVLAARSRREESLALLERALKVALENDYPLAAARAYVNLADRMVIFDRFDDADRLSDENVREELREAVQLLVAEATPRVAAAA